MLFGETKADKELTWVHLEGVYLPQMFLESLCSWITPDYHSLKSMHLVDVGLTDVDLPIGCWHSTDSKNQLSISPNLLLAKNGGALPRLELLDLSANGIQEQLFLEGKQLLLSRTRLPADFPLLTKLNSYLNKTVIYLDVSNLFLLQIGVYDLVNFLQQHLLEGHQ